jgi:hypothetical protein
MLGCVLKQIMLRSFKSVDDGSQILKLLRSESKTHLAMLMSC